MLRALLRIVVVLAGLILLLSAAQRVTEFFGRPSVALRLEASGTASDDRAINWTLRVNREGLMDIDGVPVDDLSAVRRAVEDAASDGRLILEAHVLEPLEDKELMAEVTGLATGSSPKIDRQKGPLLGAAVVAMRADGTQLLELKRDQFGAHLAGYQPTPQEAEALATAIAELAAERKDLRDRLKTAEDADAKRKLQEELGDLNRNGLQSRIKSLVKEDRLPKKKVSVAEAMARQLMSPGGAGPQADASAAAFAQAIARLAPTSAEVEAVHDKLRLMRRRWTFDVRPGGEMVLDGRPSSFDELRQRIRLYAQFEQTPTRAVTVADVKAAAARGEIRAPSRPHNSFPGRMTYEEAFPEGEEGIMPARAETPENIITEFDDAPVLHNRALQDEYEIRKYVDGKMPHGDDWDNLPPVEDRIPLYPAVMVGPDGIGNYGGMWLRSTLSDGDINTKVGYPGFIRFDPKGDLQPHFAYKWKVEDGNRVFTYWLRPGHRWSDGHPFTAHDIAFVCNVDIGSPRWSDPPNWMMATDGSTQVYTDDILDWPALAARVLEETVSAEPTPGRRLMLMIENEIPFEVDRLIHEGKLAAGKRDAVIAALQAEGDQVNELAALSDEQFAERFSELGLSGGEAAEVKRLAAAVKLHRLMPALQEIVDEGRAPGDLEQSKVVVLLNKALEYPRYYDPEVWAGFDLSSELEALRDAGPSTLDKRDADRFELLIIRDDLLRRVRLSGLYAELLKKEDAGTLTDQERDRLDALRPHDYWLRLGAGNFDLDDNPIHLKKLNVFMFRAAYRDHVTKARRERVKVEPLDDHTIRFTFKKPNSIFLEKSAHFMFYRGLFGMARHFHRRFHGDGWKRLGETDVLKWPEFLAAVRQAGQSSEPSPGRQLWTLMSDEGRELFSITEPTPDQQEAIREEVNRVLMSSREFFSREAWDGVDLTSELEHLKREGYTELTDVELQRRYLHLVQIEDMLRRGVEDLKATGEDEAENELLVFNVEMFRKAFSYPDPTAETKVRESESMIAPTRVIGLNIRAAQHPLQLENWVNYERKLGGALRMEYHTPSLTAWRSVSDPKDTMRTVAIRNPYYFAVDPAGNQLPYIDLFINDKQPQKSNRILQLSAGTPSFQVRDLDFQDYTVMKQNEDRGDYRLLLWANDYTGEVVFIPPQQREDPEFARLQADPRFRKAMSYALNRQEIIDIAYSGIGRPAQWSVPRGSRYYNEKHATMAVEYRPDLANQLLDDMGLDKRAPDGTRLLWSGRPLIMDVNTTEDRPLEVVQMACDYWQAVGINCQMKVRAGKLINRMLSLGTADIVVVKEGGNFFGPVLAGGFAPTHPAECPWGTEWVRWIRQGGRGGLEPPDNVKMLEVMWNRVLQSETEDEKAEAWQSLSDYVAEWLPAIGVMTSPGKMVYVKNGFKNVPELSLAGWIAHEPGNNCPEVFFWDKPQE